MRLKLWVAVACGVIMAAVAVVASQVDQEYVGGTYTVDMTQFKGKMVPREMSLEKFKGDLFKHVDFENVYSWGEEGALFYAKASRGIVVTALRHAPETPGSLEWTTATFAPPGHWKNFSIEKIEESGRILVVSSKDGQVRNSILGGLLVLAFLLVIVLLQVWGLITPSEFY